MNRLHTTLILMEKTTFAKLQIHSTSRGELNQTQFIYT